MWTNDVRQRIEAASEGRLFGPGIVRDAPVTVERLATRVQELRS